MKKTFLLLSLLVLAVTAKAGQPPLVQAAPPHIEFKYYGFYGVVDYTFMTNFASKPYVTIDPETGSEISITDKYTLNGISAVVGWQWRKESAVGIGFSYFYDANGSFSQIPVFVEFRSHFLRSRITPFTAVQMGYSIPFGSKNADVDYTRIEEGGITFGFSAGGRFAVSQKFGINIYAGYQLIQNRSVERGFNSVAATRLPELYHNVKFGIGVNF